MVTVKKWYDLHPDSCRNSSALNFYLKELHATIEEFYTELETKRMTNVLNQVVHNISEQCLNPEHELGLNSEYGLELTKTITTIMTYLTAIGETRIHLTYYHQKEQSIK